MVARSREMLLSLDTSGKEALYTQIYRQVADAIIAGVLQEGDHLPSIRKLSETLQVSHTTIERAYLQLSIEGFVRNVARSGYVVEKLDTDFLQSATCDRSEHVRRAEQSRNPDAFYAENKRGGEALYDFSFANLQPNSFPVKIWRQLINEVLYANTAPDFTRYTYTDEPSALSCALARYLSQARGVHCVASQVIPQAGTAVALDTILQLFDHDKHVLGIEEPGYVTTYEVAKRLGFHVVGLGVEAGTEAFLEAVERHQPKIIFMTPSHQFPTGKVLQLDARTRLLKWAKKHNAYIIEDDSCNEYRYNTSPIPSLQSLDAENRVIYLGNVSKVLSPSMRLAYLVLPPKLLGRFYRQFNHAHPNVSLLEQEVLARFIEGGHWEQHIRRMALGNRKRHDVLVRAMEHTMGDRVDMQGVNAGMHLWLTVHNDMNQEELIESAAREGVAVYGSRRYYFTKPAPQNHLLLGFSAIDEADIPAGVQALARAWFS